jgi:hypothetical protein
VLEIRNDFTYVYPPNILVPVPLLLKNEPNNFNFKNILNVFVFILVVQSVVATFHGRYSYQKYCRFVTARPIKALALY